MKNITLLIKLFTLSFTLLYSQNLISETTEKYDNGKTKTVEYFRNIRNKLELVRIENYYDNRQLQSAGEIKDSLMNGEWIYYYENGQITGKGIYQSGNGEYLGIFDIPQNGRIGQWMFYYENGQKKSVHNYDYRGLLINGATYYENGKMQSQKTSFGYTSYFENGQIKSKGNYRDEKNVGNWTFYYENGQINKELYYKEGIIDGIVYMYYKNGKIMAKGDLKEGSGLLTFFYENGKKQKEGSLINEEKHGDWILYDEEGRFVKVEEYKNGDLVKPSPKEKPAIPVSPPTHTENNRTYNIPIEDSFSVGPKDAIVTIIEWADFQ
jgi:antitoxin component YwqK of YwqJK toxin-antitoxin module